MQQITKMDRAAARTIQRLAKEALEKALAPYGVTVGSMSGTYGESSLTSKIELRLEQVSTADGKVVKAEEASFRSYAPVLGIQPDSFGARVTVGRHEYRLCDIKLNNRKYPVIAERTSDGRRYKLPADKVLSALDGEKRAVS